MVKKPFLGILVFTPFLLAGCWAMALSSFINSPEATFQRAKMNNTAVAYRDFAAKFPEHDLAIQARNNADDIEFAEAAKTNSVSAYSDFMKAHADSRHLAEAREKLAAAQRAIFEKELAGATGLADYGRLLDVQQNAGLLHDTLIVQKAQAEMDKFVVDTAGDDGFLLASSTPDQSVRDSVPTVVRVNCAVTTSRTDRLSALLSQNAVTQSLAPQLDGLSTFALAMNAFSDARKSSDAKPLLYLYPERDTDDVLWLKGALDLRDRINGSRTVVVLQNNAVTMKSESGANMEGDSVATTQNLRLGIKDDRVFTIRGNNDTPDTTAYCSVVLVLQLPLSTDLPSLSGQGFLWTLNETRIVRVSVASPVQPTLIIGKARLPANHWIFFQPGLCAKGGEVRFEGTRVLLAPGTLIARKSGS
jgi:hypothetical protein